MDTERKLQKEYLSNGLFAHSLPNRPLGDWQQLDEHLNQVADKARTFAEKFGSSDWGWNAGVLHDIGKAKGEFQKYIRHENHIDDPEYDTFGHNRVNHSSGGATLAEECFNADNKPFGRILAYLIAGHHAGLPDYYTCDGGRGALLKRLEEGNKHLESIRTKALELVASRRQLMRLPPFVKEENFHFWTRILFSCLIDADHLDTEAFMNPEKSQMRQNGYTLVKLKDALDKHMEELSANCDETLVNQARHEILEECRTAGKNKPGLFSLTVPTGGGKTLSAMSFALDHAVLHDKCRVIYVIPYTSIIEQTAEILAGIFGAENVVEHHSNLDPKKETPRTQLASENWDAPIIVTTNVQFFESLYSARPSRCRKLHNIVNSVVILDEAQMVPPNLLTPCVAVINELTQNYGVTFILSTATQPALPKLRQPTEIIPEDLDLEKRLKRTIINVPEKIENISWEDIAQRLQEHEQVLCIVNTRRDCYDLFQLMPKGTIHLSALMCGEHRSKVIQSIKEHLKANKPIRVISTQLVEAGVDIDFPVVYRALAGLDSIAQAAGRCNREGKLEQKGRVEVFVPPKSSPRGLLHKGESTTRELRVLPDFDPQSQQSLTRYFDLFYRKVNDTGEEILRRLTPSEPEILDVAFRSVGDGFHLIDNQDQRPVFVRFAEGEELIENLRQNGPNRDLLRRLQRYTVNLRSRVAEEMQLKGLLEEVWPDFLAQCPFNIYSDEIGLDVYREGIPLDDLVGV